MEAQQQTSTPSSGPVRPESPPPFNPNSAALREEDVVGMLARFLPADEAFVGDLAVYQRAMVHRSYSARPDAKLQRINSRCPPGLLPLQPESYERLEFLGDAVLGLITASYLFERYPDQDEGFMTRMRTKLINGRMLADLCARHTPLPSFIAVSNHFESAQGQPQGQSQGQSQWQSQGQSQTSQTSQTSPRTSVDHPPPRGEGMCRHVLEDVFEAFLGAMFIDRGFDAARRWLVGFYEENVDFAELAAHQEGPKATLNRHCMRNLGFLPELEEIADGVVRLMAPGGAVIATGAGATRRDAEEIAVRRALVYYGVGGGRPPPRTPPPCPLRPR